MHPLAATATPEPRTGRIFPLRGAFDDLVRLGKVDAPATADIPQSNEIPGCRERNKHHPIVQMTETITTRNQLFDTDRGRWGGFWGVLDFSGQGSTPWGMRVIFKFKIQDSRLRKKHILTVLEKRGKLHFLLNFES